MVALLLKLTDLSRVQFKNSLCGSDGYDRAVAYELYQVTRRSVDFTFFKEKNILIAQDNDFEKICLFLRRLRKSLLDYGVVIQGVVVKNNLLSGNLGRSGCQRSRATVFELDCATPHVRPLVRQFRDASIRVNQMKSYSIHL